MVMLKGVNMEKYGDFDVVVVGGGTSGVPAAIASARVGAKTLLVEKWGVLGGQMNVSGPPGFAYAYLYNGRGEQIAGGFMEETHQRLLREGHALPKTMPDFRMGTDFAFVDPDYWGLLVFQMMEESGVELMLNSLFTDVIMDGDVIKGVVVETPGGPMAVYGKVIVDCTGEGFVASKAGAPYEQAPRDVLEPHTISFTLDGVDWNTVVDFAKKNVCYEFDPMLGAAQSGWTKEQIIERFQKITSPVEISQFMGWYKLRKDALAKGEWHPNSGVGFFLMPRSNGVIQAHFQHSSQVDNVDPYDVRDMTRCEIECRKQIQIALKFINKYMPGFEKAYLTRICSAIRLRESRRIMGDYKLVKADVAAGRKFPDVIGKSAFTSGAKHVATNDTLALGDAVAPPEGGSTDIPYRCLVPQKIDNLLVGGKAVSTDRESYLRFLQITCVTGQAAGVAAALAARDGKTPRALEQDVRELQAVLKSQGAILDGTH
jgi:hypothetical protein